MENNNKNSQLQPPPGYPRLDSEQHEGRKKKKGHCCGSSCRRATKRGEASFIEGCIAALCCCWLCELCCD